MSRNSPSARYHRVLVLLSRIAAYQKYGPIIGPKLAHQHDYRWDLNYPRLKD